MLIQSTEDLGKAVQELRKKHQLTQADLALTAGTGVRFIVDVEKGKPTCEIAKVLHILKILGVSLELNLE